MVLKIAFQEVDFPFRLVKVQPVHMAVDPDREELFPVTQKFLNVIQGRLARGRKQTPAAGLIGHPQIRRAHEQKETQIEDRGRG